MFFTQSELLAHEACLVGHVEDGCDGNRCPARDIAHSNHLFPLSDRLFNYELERGETQIPLADRGQLGQFPEVGTEDLKGVHALRRREAGDKVAAHL